MSGGGKQTSTTVNKTEIPQWIDDAGQANYNKALTIDAAPLAQYGGSTVAPLSDTTKSAFQFFKDNSAAGTGDISAASDLFKGAGSAPIAMQQLKDTDLSSYMNPYVDNVETKALGALDRSRQQALMGNADKAVAAKAFGGSRSAIVDAVTNTESAREAGLLSAGLRKEAYDSAVAGATGDISRNYGAAVGNRDAAMAGASGLLSSGQVSNKMMMDKFAGMSGIGALEQAQQQQTIDADVAKFNESRDKETNDLNLRLSSLGMTPYPSTQTQTSTTPKPGTDWGTLGLGALSLFMGLSDDDSKTDKTKLGVDPETGLDIWAYRYKGDPKNYPKVVGPMASDIEKKRPDAMGPKVGGKRTIDFSKLGSSVLAAGLR